MSYKPFYTRDGGLPVFQRTRMSTQIADSWKNPVGFLYKRPHNWANAGIMGGRTGWQGCWLGKNTMIDEQQTIDEQQAVKEPVAIETERMNGSAGRRRWSVAAALVIAPLSGVALWLWGSDAYHFLTNEQALEDFVVRAGIWGPLALIFFNIVQIVIAPIPGYMVQLGAGYLYGPLWGGVYAVIGMLAGAMVAMWLALH